MPINRKLYPKLFFITPQREWAPTFHAFGMLNLSTVIGKGQHDKETATAALATLFSDRGGGWEAGVEFRSDGVRATRTYRRPKTADTSGTTFTTRDAKRMRRALDKGLLLVVVAD